MVYWQFEQNRKKGSNSLADAQEKKEMTKKMMGQNNLSTNYAQQKANRAADLPNYSKLKAEF